MFCAFEILVDTSAYSVAYFAFSSLNFFNVSESACVFACKAKSICSVLCLIALMLGYKVLRPSLTCINPFWLLSTFTVRSASFWSCSLFFAWTELIIWFVFWIWLSKDNLLVLIFDSKVLFTSIIFWAFALVFKSISSTLWPYAINIWVLFSIFVEFWLIILLSSEFVSNKSLSLS